MKPCSRVKTNWEPSYACISIFAVLGQVRKSSKVLNSTFHYFGQVVQEILQNNYLKTNFENSKIRDFVPTFWNFIDGGFLEKMPSFLNFKCTYKGLVRKFKLTMFFQNWEIRLVFTKGDHHVWWQEFCFWCNS